MSSGAYWVVDQEDRGFRTTVESIPRCNAKMGGLEEVNPGVQDAPDDFSYEQPILPEDEAQNLEDLELDEIERLLNEEIEVELERVDPGPGERLALEDGSVEDPPQPAAVRQRKPRYRAVGKQPWGALRSAHMHEALW